MRRVLGLDVVLPNGEIIETGSVGSRAKQSSAGLELTNSRLRVTDGEFTALIAVERLLDIFRGLPSFYRGRFIPTVMEKLEGQG